MDFNIWLDKFFRVGGDDEGGLTAKPNCPWAVLIALDESYLLAILREVWFLVRGLYTKHKSSLRGRDLCVVDFLPYGP